MDPHLKHSGSPFAIFHSFRRNRRLIVEMTKREIKKRYQGSVFGLAWAFINPLLMLTVYTFVFSVVFEMRWGTSGNGNRIDFALLLFTGLIIFGVFSETMNGSPGLIIGNVNYVKKVIFPLEILTWVSVGATLFHTMVNVMILLIVQFLLKGFFPFTAFLLPITLFPIILLSLGISWFLSSLGAYLRDITQILVFFTTLLMFTSAVFFPLSNLPENYQRWLRLNPIALIIEECRKILVYGQYPDWLSIGLLSIVGALVAFFGFWWFQKTRKGFADVL